MDYIIIGLAGFLGGMLNAVAGGGSFITLPALIFVGVPPISANATGTAALLPGYIASAWRFRRDIEFPKGLSITVVSIIAIMGGCLGAAILMITNQQLFSTLIPWLILFATAAFIVGPLLLKTSLLKNKNNDNDPEKPKLIQKQSNKRSVIMGLVLLVVCIYGGYFNGGLGIILLATLSLMGQTNIHGMNGLKNILSAILTAVAVVVYAVGDTIDVRYLLLLGIMAIFGGYIGAVFAYRIPQNILRGFIVFIGCLMSIGFFMVK